MGMPFDVKGVNPATGKVIALVLIADNKEQAKQHAESAGLQGVMVRPGPEEAPPVSASGDGIVSTSPGAFPHTEHSTGGSGTPQSSDGPSGGGS